jgi:hypothetical protein
MLKGQMKPVMTGLVVCAVLGAGVPSIIATQRVNIEEYTERMFILLCDETRRRNVAGVRAFGLMGIAKGNCVAARCRCPLSRRFH